MWRSNKSNSTGLNGTPNARPNRRDSKNSLARKRQHATLRVETLERRELLAADLLHNALIPPDVNGDFRVSTLDLLGVVNKLNAQSRATQTSALSGGEAEQSALTAQSTATSFNRPDVNNDGRVSLLDLLGVVNTLRAGEGEETPLAEVRQILVDASGVELPSSTVDGFKQYTIGVGKTSFYARRYAITETMSQADYLRV